MAVQFRAQAEPIPGYKLIEPLGKGGFGEVWKCAAPGGVLKAIKLVHGSLRSGHGEEVLVQQELKALTCVRGVRHPYILSIDRFDIIDGQLMIVTELADQSLWDKFTSYTAQGKTGIPREELLRYMEETAEALDLMNIQYRLQHSDIKPQNLFLIHNHVKVADFGLVKDLSGMKAMTSGCFSPLYSAPETFEGWLSEQSDQYSLGIVFQELLTGQRPFDGKNARQLLMQHMQAPPNLSSLQPADREIIARSLKKKPAERYGSCGELVRALRQSGQPVVAPPPPTPVAATVAAVAAPAGPMANAPSIVEAMQAANQSGAAYHLTFAIRCTKCGYTGRVPKKAQGKTVKCRQCETLFTALPIAEGRPVPAPPPAPRAPAPPTLLLPSSSSSLKTTPTRVQDTQRMPPVAKPTNPPPSILPPVTPAAVAPAAPAPVAAPAPAAPPEPAVECPVCGHLKHAPVENQAGGLKCLRCGCVHGARAEAPAPLSAVKSAAPATRPSSAKVTPTVECPVCGTRGFLPNPFLGGTIRCHQCGCVHRV